MVTDGNEETPNVLNSAARSEMGKTLRAQTPRAAHGDWKLASNRRDPIAVLEESSLGRVPELIPIRYGRMLASPFAFLRGSAAVMAGDLAATPSRKSVNWWTGAAGSSTSRRSFSIRPGALMKMSA